MRSKAKRKNLIFNKDKGFTLIELLVAMATFSLVMVTVSDIFLTGLGGTQRIFGSQATQESGRFIMESMAKEIRMGKINSLDGVAYASLPDGASGPYFSLNLTNARGQAVNYYFDNSAKQTSRAGEVLNSSDTETIGRIYLVKSGLLQPRLTITLNLINKSAKLKNRTVINLQTTVSSREYAL